MSNRTSPIQNILIPTNDQQLQAEIHLPMRTILQATDSKISFQLKKNFKAIAFLSDFPGKYDSTNPLKYGFYNNGNSCWNREIFHRNLLWWWLPQNNWQSWIELPPCLPAWSTICKVIIPRGAPINKKGEWITVFYQKKVGTNIENMKWEKVFSCGTKTYETSMGGQKWFRLHTFWHKWSWGTWLALA